MAAIHEYDYDISILVITYEPDKKKLLKTLRSVLLQEGVSLQVVVADDGSVNSKTEEIEALFRERGFRDYVIVNNPVNRGTTFNFYSGLEAAKGEYVKGISPGDYLFEKDTLRKWLDFMRKGRHDVSFGIPVFYSYDQDGKMKPVQRDHGNPVLPWLYSEKRYRELDTKRNCFFLQDYIVGASYFAKTELVLKYCRGLLGEVKYFEDALYRFMLLDGIHSVYYPHEVIMYEYGTGVSTSKADKWKKIAEEEIRKTEELVINSGRTDDFSKQLIAFFKEKHNGAPVQKMSYLLKKYPFVVYWKALRTVFRHMGRCKTSTACDEAFMEIIGGSDAGH